MPDEKVEATELVKGIDSKLEKKATAIVVAGVKDGKSEDEIKQAVFSLGVPFSKLNLLHKAILKNEGLAIDVKALRASVQELIEKTEFSFDETLAQLKEFANTVVENVPNASAQRVLAQLKAHWKLNEYEFPRKTAPVRGRIGAINKVVIDTFKANPKASVEDLTVALKDSTKNAAGYAKSLHTMAYALANGLSALEVLTVIAKVNEAA